MKKMISLFFCLMAVVTSPAIAEPSMFDQDVSGTTNAIPNRLYDAIYNPAVISNLGEGAMHFDVGGDLSFGGFHSETDQTRVQTGSSSSDSSTQDISYLYGLGANAAFFRNLGNVHLGVNGGFNTSSLSLDTSDILTSSITIMGLVFMDNEEQTDNLTLSLPTYRIQLSGDFGNFGAHAGILGGSGKFTFEDRDTVNSYVDGVLQTSSVSNTIVDGDFSQSCISLGLGAQFGEPDATNCGVVANYYIVNDAAKGDIREEDGTISSVNIDGVLNEYTLTGSGFDLGVDAKTPLGGIWYAGAKGKMILFPSVDVKKKKTLESGSSLFPYNREFGEYSVIKGSSACYSLAAGLGLKPGENTAVTFDYGLYMPSVDMTFYLDETRKDFTQKANAFYTWSNVRLQHYLTDYLRLGVSFNQCIVSVPRIVKSFDLGVKVSDKGMVTYQYTDMHASLLDVSLISTLDTVLDPGNHRLGFTQYF